jgi:hypothetical protein
VKVGWWIGILLLLAACSPLPTVTDTPLTPTGTSTPTPTLTATIVWFPPTVTPTPRPTVVVTPTPEMRPGIGLTLLVDSFTDPKAWPQLSGPSGNIAVGAGELTLSVAKVKTTLVVIRNGFTVGDFYMEVTVLPALCSSNDIYGVLVRASGPYNGYRLLVNCNGELRLERLINGEVSLLQNWVASPQIQPLAPLPVKLGVWAAGNELRVFAGDVYQFSVTDPVYAAGGVGFYARTTDSATLTVHFSELRVAQVELVR